MPQFFFFPLLLDTDILAEANARMKMLLRFYFPFMLIFIAQVYFCPLTNNGFVLLFLFLSFTVNIPVVSFAATSSSSAPISIATLVSIVC